MSQHRSLRASATLGGKRNVLSASSAPNSSKSAASGRTATGITGLRKTKPDV